MQLTASSCLLSRVNVDLSAFQNKSDVSKGLFGQIQWDDITRSGVRLQPKDVSLTIETIYMDIILILHTLACSPGVCCSN